MTLSAQLADAVVAAADLVGRSGATSFEIGYLHDDVPADEAGWYATAYYRGARLTGEHPSDPARAAEALARAVLNGARCTHCNGEVLIGDQLPTRRNYCQWRREGQRWTRGCEGRR